MRVLLISSLLALSFTAVKAQNKPTAKASPTSVLEQKFNSLKSNSNSYKERDEDYKVVRVKSLNSFWETVQSTIQTTESQLQKARAGNSEELVEAQGIIEQQKQEIAALKQDNEQKELAVQESTNLVNNISVFGLNVNKQFYVIINSVIIIGLLIALAVIFSMFNSSRQVAVKKQKAFDEIDEELNTYKKNAREKELKIKRELQTEMNRVEELKQEIASLQRHPSL
ncbi:hypothetical protein [Pontibacter harenae]|uniref:hypothetical protein n=1 Tax=Pontibacter harenae TaxID=2894083 RepID=UPI001E2B8888|nr:hypothetical protein [Pontibacter harenae]MCC9169030.1 hypothetical protein [Pontibacter harenae]